MKDLSHFVLIGCVIFFIAWGNNLHSQSWSRIQDYPGAERDDATGFYFKNSYWCGTGLATGWLAKGDFFKFDPATKQWSNATSLPGGAERQYATSCSLDTSVFVFGGSRNGVFLNDLHKLRSDEIGWITLPSAPFPGRDACASFILDSSIYILGGGNAANPSLKEVWSFNYVNNTWSRKNDLPVDGFWRGNSFVYSGKAYFIFGRNSSGSYNRYLYEYDKFSDQWSIVSSFPEVGRTYAGIAVSGSKLYVAAGSDSLNYTLNDLWSFDLVSMEWSVSSVAAFSARKGGLLFGNSDDLFYTTGIDNNNARLKETWWCKLTTGMNENSGEYFKFNNDWSEEVQISSTLQGECLFELFDIGGRLIFKSSFAGDFIYPTSRYRKGVYLVRLSNAMAVVSTKGIIR